MEQTLKTDWKKLSREERGEIFNKSIKLLNSDCPTKCCEWCDGR